MNTPAAPKSTSRTDPLVGTLLAGKYQIIKKIGEGGMGSVYIADQQPIDRKVAVKVLLGKLAEDDVAVKRFEQEARAISKMQHPNTVTIYDFGKTEDDRLYIVMEYLKGKTLTQVLRNDGVLAPARACKIMRQVCGSLADAHAAGIIHRDLKPDNIFLSEVGGDPDWVKVLDFGVAKLADGESGGTLTQTGMIFGTPKYMSPEQAEGRPIDFRADIYALGVVMYELLVGRPPFVADTPVGLLLKHISEPAPPFARVRPDLSLDPRLEAIVMRSLEKLPDRRQQVVGDLASELGAFERALSGGVMLPGQVGALTAPQAVPGLPTEVVSGASPGSMGLTPAGLRPPNQVPGNLSLSLPTHTQNMGGSTGMATAQQALAHTQGQVPTAMSTVANGALPTAALGAQPTAPLGAFTHGLTSPIAAPGGGVDTLNGLGVAGLKPTAQRPVGLYAAGGLFGLAAVAAGVFFFAGRGGGAMDEPIREAQVGVATSAQPSGQVGTGKLAGEAERGTAGADPSRPASGIEPTRPGDVVGTPSSREAGGTVAGNLPQAPRDAASKKGEGSRPAEATSRTVKLSVQSSPAGATVYLDGKQSGRTPFDTTVPRDETMTLVFEKEGFEKLTRPVSTASDRTIAVELKPLPETAAGLREPVVDRKVTDKPAAVAPKKVEAKLDVKLDEKVDDLK